MKFFRGAVSRHSSVCVALVLLSGHVLADSNRNIKHGAPAHAPSHGKPVSGYEYRGDYQNALPDYGTIRNPDAWHPEDRKHYDEMIRRISSHVDDYPAQTFTPAVENLRTLIETNPRIYMYFVSMFEEVPQRFPYWMNTDDKPKIRDYPHLLQILNHIVTRGPDVDTVGVPMVVILSYPMGTASGHAAFLDPAVNHAFKKILNEWGRFLQTPASQDVLGTDSAGWFGKQKMAELEQAANAPYHTKKTFEELFVCDPSAKSHGFSSWDDFFTRHFRKGIRPVADPEDDNVIANACESKAYNVDRNVQLRDRFFVKGQPYSVLDMLAYDPLSARFANGTVYQAFLSPLSYHRWHSPVSGTVKSAYLVDGTYFSVPLSPGFYDRNQVSVEPMQLQQSQAYLTALAARAVIIIEADNPALGLVAFVGVGMDEVSTCEIEVKEGQHVKKGQEMGMFHFGGSSHVLLFEGGVELAGFPAIGKNGASNVPLRSRLAVVKKSKYSKPHDRYA